MKTLSQAGEELAGCYFADNDHIAIGVSKALKEAVVCQNDNEAYGAMDAMDAAGITYGVDGDVIIISFDATHDGLQYTLDGKITCNVECNPLQAGFAEEVIKKLVAGETVDKWTLVEDEAFVAPGIESAYAVTMSQEVLDGRAY